MQRLGGGKCVSISSEPRGGPVLEKSQSDFFNTQLESLTDARLTAAHAGQDNHALPGQHRYRHDCNQGDDSSDLHGPGVAT